jgi:hypothetical protein
VTDIALLHRARKPKRHEHRWGYDDHGRLVAHPLGAFCIAPDCGLLKQDYEARQRRGRNNRSRGNRSELDIARTYGGEKVGPLGLPEDIRGKQWATQVKVSQRTPPPMWLREFGKLAGGSRTPRLILRFTRKGGLPHDRTQDFIVVRGEDWLAWFGKDE